MYREGKLDILGLYLNKVEFIPFEEMESMAQPSELRRGIEHIVISSDGGSFSSTELCSQAMGINDDPVKNAEKNYIKRTLEKHRGHRGKTAEELGIDKSTLWRKMKRYNLL